MTRLGLYATSQTSEHLIDQWIANRTRSVNRGCDLRQPSLRESRLSDRLLSYLILISSSFPARQVLQSGVDAEYVPYAQQSRVTSSAPMLGMFTEYVPLSTM